ncbi:hypothetical protein [Burkholderia ubonensis]|uniref:hypothetical protein n=1 Tax=Burkholderia ubonensis TaxID=101571 RepID=UPI000B0C9C18|nr:hypothetical protein [Burkholderia ubonensis]
MAYLYCSDVQSGYCFSLSRFPADTSIEIMVIDERNFKVGDLASVQFSGHSIHVVIDARTAAHLDGAPDTTLRSYPANTMRTRFALPWKGSSRERPGTVRTMANPDLPPQHDLARKS